MQKLFCYVLWLVIADMPYYEMKQITWFFSELNSMESIGFVENYL